MLLIGRPNKQPFASGTISLLNNTCCSPRQRTFCRWRRPQAESRARTGISAAGAARSRPADHDYGYPPGHRSVAYIGEGRVDRRLGGFLSCRAGNLALGPQSCRLAVELAGRGVSPIAPQRNIREIDFGVLHASERANLASLGFREFHIWPAVFSPATIPMFKSDAS
jgi:hypothetical protein